ncbi:MAG: class 1 fructose-bisphosphatase [Halodesulfurarchaeum sp.]
MTEVVEAVFDTVAELAPHIRAGLPGRRQTIEEENPTDDEQLAADVWADDLLLRRLSGIEGVGAYASEEREEVMDTGDGYEVAVDPLDGSSNLKSNNPMGTVVGIYDASLPARGRSLVASGFVLYGPITTMVVADGESATQYIVEDGTRNGVGRVTLPDDPTVYGFGGRVPDWPDDFASYVAEIEQELKLRYGGAMIADVSQVLTYGGIFAYPALESRPDGKLRLLFEGAPVGFVVESAGGASSDGATSLLDVAATDLHQRTPVHVGNTSLIERLEEQVSR